MAPTIQPAQPATRGSDGSLQAGEPGVLLGDSGTGKMHLLIGSGLPAGNAAKSATPHARSWSTNFVDAADERVLSRVLTGYSRLTRYFTALKCRRNSSPPLRRPHNPIGGEPVVCLSLTTPQ